jgi:hypothetical protein
VFPKRPAKKPLPGARYATRPESGAKFGFWHPRLVTLHVWLWYHNPRGLFNPTNPLVAPFT